MKSTNPTKPIRLSDLVRNHQRTRLSELSDNELSHLIVQYLEPTPTFAPGNQVSDGGMWLQQPNNPVPIWRNLIADPSMSILLMSQLQPIMANPDWQSDPILSSLPANVPRLIFSQDGDTRILKAEIYYYRDEHCDPPLGRAVAELFAILKGLT